MKKLLVLVLSALIGGALAQDSDGWQHTLAPAFGEPFDFVQMPWPKGMASPASIQDCWADEQPPFFGSSWRYWCYSLGEADARGLNSDLSAAFRDAGLSEIWADLTSPFSFDTNGLQADALFRDTSSQNRFRYWLFQSGEQAFIGLATGTQ